LGNEEGRAGMMEDQRAVVDWEWRLVASDRERRRAIERGRRRRHRRLLLSGLIVAAVMVSAVLAAAALSLPAPYARAAFAAVAGDLKGAVSAEASRTDNEVTADAVGAGGAATWGGGSSGAFSYVLDGALISNGTVSLKDVSLLEGRITASSIELVANAAATREAVSGGVDVSRVEDLQVDGHAVAPDDLPLVVAGIGKLSALERRVVADGGALEVEVTGLRLRLSGPWRALEEGAEIVVGVAAACADRETADRLLPPPVSGSSQHEDDTSGGSSGGSGGGASGGASPGSDDDSAGIAPTGGSGSSSTADSFTPGHMPAPGKVSGKLLAFPGAVFPVSGEVWYGDDFAVVRAPGIRHGACDIFARKGTPVVAVQDGVVTEIRYRSLGGNSFHLTNDRGDYFYYAHLLRYADGVEEGALVTAGQVIGYVGNSGNAITTPPHLHFEIHSGGGGPIDPFPYLELWRGAEIEAASPEEEYDDPGVAASSRFGSAGRSWAESQGRHERAVTVAGAAPGPLAPSSGFKTLLPAALSFGLLGGLVTSVVRRRRAELWLLATDPDDLRRSVPIA
jgi:hypothetical protein